MRSIRGLVTVLALLASASQVSAAQEGRSFSNAWFWGVKAGGSTYSAKGTDYVIRDNQVAPTVGGDWLITRTRGALMLSYSQGFLDDTTQLYIWPGEGDQLYLLPDQGMDTLVTTIRNTRRFDAVGLLIPQMELLWTTRLYFGIGVSFQQVATATYDASGYSVPQQYYLGEEVKRVRTNVAPVLMLGLQTKVPFLPISLFAQGTGITTRKDFMLKGAAAGILSAEVGVRYNIGSAIEKDIR